jgi:hypothetical protein
MRPCDTSPFIAPRVNPAYGLTCLFNRPYLSVIGSAVMSSSAPRWCRTHGLTEPYEIASMESDDQI